MFNSSINACTATSHSKAGATGLGVVVWGVSGEQLLIRSAEAVGETTSNQQESSWRCGFNSMVRNDGEAYADQGTLNCVDCGSAYSALGLQVSAMEIGRAHV